MISEVTEYSPNIQDRSIDSLRKVQHGLEFLRVFISMFHVMDELCAQARPNKNVGVNSQRHQRNFRLSTFIANQYKTVPLETSSDLHRWVDQGMRADFFFEYQLRN